MMQNESFRLASGGRIDRSRELRFSFDGRQLAGYDGDTLASALLANGVRVVSRSFKFHRPRGILSAGIEEPSAIVSVGRGAFREPNVRATVQPLYEGLEAHSQSGWPTLAVDAGRVNDWAHDLFPAGFYNKTFMWPGWRWYESAVRRAAGRAPAPAAADPDAYESRHASCDVLVVGGGPSGMLAALAAGQAGARVLIAEQEGALGGSLLWEREDIGDSTPAMLRLELSRSLEHLPNVRTLRRASVAGAYDHGVHVIHERVAVRHGPEPAPCRERFWHVRAREVILATGAIEQPLVFANNDRPGVMLAGAVRRYVNQFAVAPGRRVVVAANNDGAYQTALDLHEAGIEVVAVIDSRPASSGALCSRVRASDIRVIAGAAVVDTTGGSKLSSVLIRRADGKHDRIGCDCLAASAGLNPTLHLLSQARGRLRFDARQRCLVPHGIPPGMSVVGAARGEFDIAMAWPRAVAAGVAAAGRCGFHKPAKVRVPSLQSAIAQPAGEIDSSVEKPARAWIDLAHDITARDIDIAVRENLVSVEHFKRYTTTGMSVDQGKTSNLNALVMLADATHRSVEETGTTTFRPPFAPVTLGAIAGGRAGRFYRLCRELPTCDEQAQLGAAFEEIGGWRRPNAYLRPGEQEPEAVAREVRAVRGTAGLFEASPLGKILVRGPDAGEFLDRIYANTMRTLGIGRVRYGIMLDEKGVIIDDGVCAKLAEEEFWVSTTSGGASRIASWLEEWLQCEWARLRVVITPVTAQWATFTLAGPRAREVLARLDSDIEFSAAAFPHMHVRTGQLADSESRVFRVSFSGELSFEINVPAHEGARVWGALLGAGRDIGITPYGIEALQTLRVEKGYIHVGSDTDGTTIPDDIGWGAALERKSGDFVGRRSLSLPEHRRPDRLQLVGLRADDEQRPLETGAHVLARHSTRNRHTSEGYVTSARVSPILGHQVALAMLARGRARHGESVTLFSQGRQVRARVVPPVFYDAAGERLHG